MRLGRPGPLHRISSGRYRGTRSSVERAGAAFAFADRRGASRRRPAAGSRRHRAGSRSPVERKWRHTAATYRGVAHSRTAGANPQTAGQYPATGTAEATARSDRHGRPALSRSRGIHRRYRCRRPDDYQPAGVQCRHHAGHRRERQTDLHLPAPP